VLPILERLLFRPRDISVIRVLVVTPTRELALQIHEVLHKLARFTDITSCLISGGKKDIKSQEAMLRQGPDIVICTPGRFIDHLRNSAGISVEEVDVLVLDEVDRLLDLGFQEEVEELLKYCPVNRQTLIFSATMTPKVEDLAKLSLRRPVRVKTEASVTTVAPRLIQEFVKIKDSANEREATALALVQRTFHHRCIIFFETKKDTHRFYIILKLQQMKVAELHGDMTQTHRYLALEDFKAGRVDILVCTDVAARGLDIPGIRTVINAEMPRNASTYIHRVGRTARAGCGGRAVTLVSDDRRRVMKEVLKGEGSALSSDGGQVLSRSIPAEVLLSYRSKLHELETSIIQAMQDERVNRKLDDAEREARKAENMIRYEEEIGSRPARTWYQSEYQKKEIVIASTAKAEAEALEAKLGKTEIMRRAALKVASASLRHLSCRSYLC
jgi:ATP-dependent RNA helicase DDX27